jgi:hypothetical protein
MLNNKSQLIYIVQRHKINYVFVNNNNIDMELIIKKTTISFELGSSYDQRIKEQQSNPLGYHGHLGI